MISFYFLDVIKLFNLDITKKFGTKCAITDFSILLGGDVSTSDFVHEYSNLQPTGLWWCSDLVGGNVAIVNFDGQKSYILPTVRNIGARPYLFYYNIASNVSNKIFISENILEIEYGEYPQTVESNRLSCILEKNYCEKKLNCTGKIYVTDSVSIYDEDVPFQARYFIEYEYDNIKYIRFVSDSNCVGKVLSTGKIIQENTPYWVKVEPIKWLVDCKTNIALSKKILFSGVQFNSLYNDFNNFEVSNIKMFMYSCFLTDIGFKLSAEILEEQKRVLAILKHRYQDELDKLNRALDKMKLSGIMEEPKSSIGESAKKYYDKLNTALDEMKLVLKKK